MPKTKRGFAVGDNAVRAAKKNHELGTAHRFNSESGRRAGCVGAERRWHERRQSEPRVTEHCDR